MTPKERAAMQQALEALETIVEIDQFQGGEWETGAYKTITALREALEQPVKQEPSCSQHPDAPHGFARNASHGAGRYVCECEGWEPEQEPVAVVEITYGREPECYVTGNINDFPEGVFKLYAAPVRTKDLTDDAIKKLQHKIDWTAEWSYVNFARAVIAADRSKNGII